MEAVGGARPDVILQELPQSGVSPSGSVGYIQKPSDDPNLIHDKKTGEQDSDSSNETSTSSSQPESPDSVDKNETSASIDSHNPEVSKLSLMSGFGLHHIDSKSISSQANPLRAGDLENSISSVRGLDANTPLVMNQVNVSGDIGIDVHLLRSRCRVLEQSHQELEAKNRTLDNEVERLKMENQQINTKLLSIMSAVAKLSAQTRSSVMTSESNYAGSDVKGATSQESEKAAGAESNKVDESEIVAKKLISVEEQLDSVIKKLAISDTESATVKSRLDVIDGKVDWLESELQRYVRRHSIIIENFCPKEDRSASEIFLLFANSVLGVQLDDSDIDSLHLIDRVVAQVGDARRSGSTSSPEKRPRPVLVTFTCYRARAQVYRAWLSFRTSAAADQASRGSLSGERGQGLCIREFLTEQQEAAYLEALDAREKKLVADCWTFKGKTFVRTLAGEIREFINKEQSLPRDESKAACVMM